MQMSCWQPVSGLHVQASSGASQEKPPLEATGKVRGFMTHGVSPRWSSNLHSSWKDVKKNKTLSSKSFEVMTTIFTAPVTQQMDDKSPRKEQRESYRIQRRGATFWLCNQ